MEHGFDALDPPGPLPIRRVCVRRDCRNDARPSGKLCRTHHAKAMKAWRDRRRAAGPSTACPSSSPPSATTEATRARKRLQRDRKRGKVQPAPCAICTSRKGVVAAHPDPARPEAIVWACRRCRHELIKGEQARRAEAQAASAHRNAAELQARRLSAALEALDLLPPEVANPIRERASRGGPFGHLRPETLLYQQRVAAEIDRLS